ncbi:hypothetical protein GE118_02585 [Mycoplasma sp. NEAQ87857]|uniref:RDD family protein n=1 Tax=Mycoplasma sp. NEAQ87857 TaxID=2683967 RepID=UPI00131955EE|nr:RDD family protein [Mycoplasma sp. NEAQ87857]QGZ97681.1 hypothetical protein GE118_02585 [Mycoplasma sp. NEAQ87857]
MYQNSGLLRRFFANLFDFILTIFISIVFFATVLNKTNDHNLVDITKSTKLFYTPFILMLFWINFYYIVMPLLFKGRTLFYWIFGIKIIYTQTKTFDWKLIVKRNYLGCLYFSIVIILFLVFIHPNHFHFKDNKIALDNTIYTQIVIKVLSIFLYVWVVILGFGSIFMIFNRKKLTLIDKITDSRVVLKDQIILEEKQEIMLLPFYNYHRNYKYLNNINNKGEEYDT